MATTIMIVRHGEKPDKDEAIHGVSADGEHDKNELSPQGWQRSGALIRFFNPVNGQFSNPALAKPDAIFAAGPSGHAKRFLHGRQNQLSTYSEPSVDWMAVGPLPQR